jgi:5S rRNA maturation endonuclease (ribonuclease M5)
LSAHLQQKREKLQEILSRLSEEIADGIPIIVEGKKDAEALNVLGVRGKIVAAKSGGRSLLAVVTEAKDSGACEAVLLLDHDRRGKEWTARLKNLLEHEGITPNTIFWAELFGLVGREIKDVEGLASYMETLNSKISSAS